VGRHRLSLLICATLVVGGCGPTPPQAPGPQAHQLNESLSSISSACGTAAQIQAFSKDRRALAATERTASKQVPTLARIYKQNPNWIFQGKSVSELVQMSSSYLDECGLHRAAGYLRAATSSG
jgi:uncharacterized protein YjiS (DUF1127 family)